MRYLVPLNGAKLEEDIGDVGTVCYQARLDKSFLRQLRPVGLVQIQLFLAWVYLSAI